MIVYYLELGNASLLTQGFYFGGWEINRPTQGLFPPVPPNPKPDPKPK